MAPLRGTGSTHPWISLQFASTSSQSACFPAASPSIFAFPQTPGTVCQQSKKIPGSLPPLGGCPQPETEWVRHMLCSLISDQANSNIVFRAHFQDLPDIAPSVGLPPFPSWSCFASSLPLFLGTSPNEALSQASLCPCS